MFSSLLTQSCYTTEVSVLVVTLTHTTTVCVTRGREAPRTSRGGSRVQSSSTNKLAWSCKTAGVKSSHRIQARASGPLDKKEKQAELPIKQNPLFPYLSFQEGMLASELLNNV